MNHSGTGLRVVLFLFYQIYILMMKTDEIARIFRVPPHMVGDLEKSSFSNIEQQSLEFVKYTLDP